ncbi:hypothetical protein GWI33_016543 [Rhynchophorus ferrugineus]|uniref:Uncharacterized protein n=1 Tax=Rhynchophorus ferrugineus TaxID=354439 RepID=A0A834I3D7_RHYFE|nr:hypothetical protein GWI33_016543 [Rhynchophorus ferrugineus]
MILTTLRDMNCECDVPYLPHQPLRQGYNAYKLKRVSQRLLSFGFGERDESKIGNDISSCRVWLTDEFWVWHNATRLRL